MVQSGTFARDSFKLLSKRPALKSTILTRRTYAGRTIRFAYKQVLGLSQRFRDQVNASYLSECSLTAPLHCYFGSPFRQKALTQKAGVLSVLTASYLQHRFDLLGSGWVQIRHGMPCLGIEGIRYESPAPVGIDEEGRWLRGRINTSNLKESQRIWQLIDPGYVPIDWQLDFKSGYRWSEKTWYLDIRYAQKPGVDIKVPWELARMQHLTQLGWAFALARSGTEGFENPQRYRSEFRSQVLDFVANNPPRFGVNWRSTMEVAIRGANLAVAADLFRAAGANFDQEFETLLLRTLYEHGLHIESNLEWDPLVRGNHYLANVAGLLVLAAYLPPALKTDAWLAFAMRELIAEAEFQFAPDGTHREASTSYHRLAAEMMAYATAFVLAMPPSKVNNLQCHDQLGLTLGAQRLSTTVAIPAAECREKSSGPFPMWYLERLERMAEFVAHMTKANGRVPQVGDNDSGRFLRFDSSYRQMTAADARARYANLASYQGLESDATYWDEDHLDHRGIAGAIGTLFNRQDLVDVAGESSVEVEVMRGLTGAKHLPSYRCLRSDGAEAVRIGSIDELQALKDELRADEAARHYEIVVKTNRDLSDSLACFGYPDFGLYIFRSEMVYLAVRCGRFGLVGNGGHAHHDQLSVELSLNGQDLIVDPGTYLYTALGARRNQYRSDRAHFAPQLEREQPRGTGLGLFEMRDRSAAKCVYFGSEGFAGCHWAYGLLVYRIIEIDAGAIRICDAAKGGASIRPLSLAFGYRCGWRESLQHSPGYGIVVRDA
jgi:hypothetical protein